MVKNGPEKRPTLYDVAELAGVSHQTVSRVINNKPYVSDETRERVMAAMLELNYQPSRAAQIMTTRRSYTLEVLMTVPGYSGPLIETSNVAREAGYHVTIVTTPESNFKRALTNARARAIDGLLFIAPDLEASYEELQSLCKSIPFVCLSADLGPDSPSYIFEQRRSTRALVEHLLDLGHRDFVEIAGAATTSDSKPRHESLIETLAERGLKLRDSERGDFNTHKGYLGMREILRRGADFTAVVAANDAMAMGAIHALHDAGRKVPQDVSIVGFDDIEQAEHTIPPLTTVRQDFNELNRQATRYLIDLIERPDKVSLHRHVLDPKLIIRQSAAPPKGQL
jgi:DNA-binding LacI/PurR family transcriptional regulator